MPCGISRLTALVVPLALLMPLNAALGQEPVSSAAAQRKIVQIDQQFVIRSAARQAERRPAVKLGSAIRVDRALLTPTPLFPAKSSQAHHSQGGINETR